MCVDCVFYHSVHIQGFLDYEVDSDDEWEEEEPGESLSNSEVSNSKIGWQREKSSTWKLVVER